MPTPKSQIEEQKHYHVWKSDGYSQDNCAAPDNGQKCKWIRVSGKEYQRRTDEWNNYFEMAHSSQSYLDYLECRKYFNAYRTYKDPASLQALKEVVKNSVSMRCKPTGEDFYNEPMYEFVEEEYIPKPTFPDPTRYSYYFVVEGQA